MREGKKKKLKNWIKKWWWLAVCAVIGGAAGFWAGAAGVDLDLKEFAYMLAEAVIVLALSFYAHIILHEGGHLVCGLLSGYRFVSFRIGSLMVIRIRGKLRIRRFSIPGTGGQCLLDPPEFNGGDYPSMLYNLGGGLFNLIFAMAALGLYPLAGSRAAAALVVFAGVGGFLAATNLIPMKMSGVANDGYNMKYLKKDKASYAALWRQLRVNRLQSDGLRLSAMDAGLFETESDSPDGNPLIDGIRVLNFQRLMDQKDFDAAAEYGRRLLAAKGFLPVYGWLVRAELLYLELTGPCRPEKVDALYDRNLQRAFRQMKGYPSVHRARYAYAVRFAHDEKLAAAARRQFERTIRRYPMEGEIQLEKELMEVI